MNTCAVCLDPIIPASPPFQCDQCNQHFHVGCVDEWFMAQLTEGRPATCPLCRSVVIDMPSPPVPTRAVASWFGLFDGRETMLWTSMTHSPLANNNEDHYDEDDDEDEEHDDHGEDSGPSQMNLTEFVFVLIE